MDRMIENKVTGDRIHFLSSPLLGDGEELVFRASLPPFAAGAPAHVHDGITETFEVESGVLDVILGDGRTLRLRAGQSVTLAPGISHAFRNPDNREAVFITTASPGAELERFLRAMYALANEGLTDRAGAPRNPLVMAAVLDRIDMTMAGVPRGLQRALIRALGVLARCTGVAARVAQLVGESAA